MSFSNFAVTVRPDSRRHQQVVCAHLVCLCVGLVVVLRLPAGPAMLAGLSIAWLALALAGLRNYVRGWRDVRELRLSPGLARRLDTNGIWVDSSIAAGTLVLRSVIWLRLEREDAGPLALLLTRRDLPARDWRRLQALLRLAF